MGIFNFNRQETLKTPYGRINLAKASGQKKAKSIVVDLQMTTDSLTRKDLADWRQAWQMAINVENPNRQRLYDIYRDVAVDLHLSGCMQQRRDYVLSRSFKIAKADGTEDADAATFFDQIWFKQLMRYCLESIYWGYSLIELGDVINEEGRMGFTDVTLFPRKHVIPEKGRVVLDKSQDWTAGIDYRQPPYADWLIEAGQPDDLGLFLKAATQTISKKNCMSFWDTFAEIFGMPMRIAKTTSRDPKDQTKIEAMMDKMGAALWGVFPEGTDIQVVETKQGDAYNVYDKRIDRANSELSKLVIGQTMTLENGSSQSQSETHLKVFSKIVESDGDMIRDIVNNQLIPKMVLHGFPLQGCSFEWNDEEDYTAEEQVNFETMLLNNYEVDPKYFVEKYGVPVLKRKEQPVLNRKSDGGFFD